MLRFQVGFFFIKDTVFSQCKMINKSSFLPGRQYKHNVLKLYPQFLQFE